jgi:tetratricopeptide (TPR) repeat protein
MNFSRGGLPSARNGPPPAFRLRRPFPLLPWVDLPLLLLAAFSIAALLGVRSLYRPGAQNSFPREESDFASPEDLRERKAAALEALGKNPDDIAVWTDLAVANFQLGPDYYLAPEDASGLKDLGALEALEKARDLGALDVRLFYYAGVMYEAKGLPDYAKPEYERFLRHRPGDLEVRLRLGNLYYRLGEPDKAAEQYKKVLEAKPLDPLVAFNLASVYQDQEKWSEGLEILDRVSAAGRRLPAGEHKLRGNLHRGAGQFAKALDHYRKDLSENGGDAELFEGAALAYEGLKEDEGALANWLKVLETNPKHRKAQERARQLKRKARK